ncbi:hypothetical protein PENTCL1PPCAC_3887 [Pristionchus entomophagus]|uniref:Fibronectin type-III domain-containing protein n=1 Tax=Pristionchus entomophagus TaxID=358040 RepID=A0AAV5SGB1_9BILA|nr:hypothetical protein PENTCL1PPCAC_3887 [Pristionchus entomophagus]
MRETSLSVLLLLVLSLANAGPSQRGKCALECYSRCLSAGASSAVFCNCPIQKTFSHCSSIEERLNTAPVGTLAGASTEYFDAHSIKVKIGSVEGAFIYVFEYSTISTAPDQWLFAGASSSPSITFTVMDPCRDYQFRVLAIVRPSTTGQNDVVIYRALPIPVQLPAFVLHPDQISVESPQWNSTEEQVKVYVRWSLPRGYSDSDVYGYEAPAIYPIECEGAPEEELPTPKIEIVRNGGRLAVWLPSKILETRCRLWVEVHMLPRCVRLEPFSVQKAIELDCAKTPDEEACRHASADALPECTDVIDVWGKRGEATVMWQAPARNPLSYSIRFGRATVQDAAPLVSWSLTNPKTITVDGNRTSISLKLEEGVDYGIQVCAIYSDRRLPKYDLVKVTPLMCRICRKQGDKQHKCGECSKIEFPENELNDEAEAIEDTSRQASTTPLITLDEEEEKAIEGIFAAREANTHQVETPLVLTSLQSAKSDDWDQPSIAPPTSSSTMTSSSSSSSSTTSTSSSSSFPIDAVDSSAFDDILTTLNAEGKGLFEEDADMIGKTARLPVTVVGESLASNRVPTEWPTGLTTNEEQGTIAAESLTPTTTRPATTVAPRKTTVATSTVPTTTTTTTAAAKKEKSRLDQPVKLRMSTAKPSFELRSKIKDHQPTSRLRDAAPCYLASGIRCSHGCDQSNSADPERCLCPSPLTVMADGSCYEMRPSCLQSERINATWDPSTMDLMVSDSSINQTANRLFVDVGAVARKAAVQFIEPTKIRQRQEIVIMPNRPSGLVHHIRLNQSLDSIIDYGIRVCQYRAGPIAPLSHNWEEIGEDTIAIISKLMGASTAEPTQEKELPPVGQSYWGAFFTIGKVAILVALVLIMSVLVYLNCARLKTFYDRKRTHYFRPFIIEGQRERSVAARYPMGLPRTNPDLISYPTRSRVL